MMGYIEGTVYTTTHRPIAFGHRFDEIVGDAEGSFGRAWESLGTAVSDRYKEDN